MDWVAECVGGHQITPMDIERTLQELAQNACVGEELSGFYSYGYNCEDVDDYHASTYGDLLKDGQYHIVGTERRARSHRIVRAPRLGRISVEAINLGGSGSFLPTHSETQRTGLTLKGRETVVIQQGHSVEVATGLRPISFLGSDIRVTQRSGQPGKDSSSHDDFDSRRPWSRDCPRNK
jgi:hypothetical protein